MALVTSRTPKFAVSNVHIWLTNAWPCGEIHVPINKQLHFHYASLLRGSKLRDEYPTIERRAAESCGPISSDSRISFSSSSQSFGFSRGQMLGLWHNMRSTHEPRLLHQHYFFKNILRNMRYVQNVWWIREIGGRTGRSSWANHEVLSNSFL